ncbi:MAG: 30S ribosomal protein S20 [Candidatus Phytoplasma stylosanthis]|uniref:30S ribosomal protein S20 n=1 Tax=Candidatus Phytoplasma stylosanthis TaxID=2798314 RepID=UPI00293B15D4|nr:30S ribosomal protein S20 [Candidatus Phytoplasma stylosanthis]MDV3167825.1 30S ribosomal protein S20 [Candidatus Phytoplasma stylosanthis]MDV3170898.1 30S ribosomal protein S20 [Candidatus Phytoplasma stylosanthis]MDV3174078.1 30S ribosomal protein S20 [Candidatus Phytoplasma stylosanthis]MDV3202410.1 30S ribosomal protein S20 [Candidatus Phytoplasma stylosanthis]
MANIKQQKKRVKTNEKRRLINRSFKSSVRTFIKKFKKSVAYSDKDKAISFLNIINKKLDKGRSKRIYHINFVSRNKSNLAKLLNSIN